MTGGEVKILVVDDHALVRSTLAERLGREQGFEVVGTAENADEAITMALEFGPDIVLMDIDMPGLLCFEAAERITSLCPDTHIIYLSAFYNDRFIAQALAAKARGYVTKSEPPDMVVQAIREVAAGGAYGIIIPPSIIMILYALISHVGISKMFMGGVLPGLTGGILFCLYIGIRCWFKPEDGPPIPPEERVGVLEKIYLFDAAPDQLLLAQ